MTTPYRAIRDHQEADPQLGPLYVALYAFAHRTSEHFFGAPLRPLLSFEDLRRNRRGRYMRVDSYGFAHAITLNPFALKTGEDAAETLAHELVHMWLEVRDGTVFDGAVTIVTHGPAFHEHMHAMGLMTEGPHGECKSHGMVDGEPVWANWLVENEDLGLGRFILGGTN